MAARDAEPAVILRDALAHAHAALQSLAARVAQDASVEAVHEFRVGARRARAALSLFKPALPGAARGVAKRLRALARTMAELRDIDVTLERLAQWGPAEGAQQALQARRAKLAPRAQRVVHSQSARRTLATLASAPALKKTARMAALLRRIEARFGRARKRATRKATHENLHKLRLRGKELRYVLELLDARKPARKALRALQECLGEFFDAHLVQAALEKHAPGHAMIKLCARKQEARRKRAAGLLARLDKDMKK